MVREIAAMRVACVQYDIAWHDKQANFAKVRSLLAASGGCQPGGLIVLPEMFSTGFSMDLQATAEGQLRPAEVFLAELARHYGCHVLGGVVNVAADGLGRNEALLIGPALPSSSAATARTAGESDFRFFRCRVTGSLLSVQPACRATARQIKPRYFRIMCVSPLLKRRSRLCHSIVQEP